MKQHPRFDVICLGEAMGEIAFSAPAAPQVSVGGDTFNTAVYLGRAGLRVAFASMVGADPFGGMVRCALRDNGVSDDLLRTHPSATTGLYTIENDASGERSFAYWRETSAARQSFVAPPAPWLAGLGETALLYLSGISLFAFRAQAEVLFETLADLRTRGVRIAFDGNFRPRLWQDDLAQAQKIHARVVSLSDICLPTFEDEALLWGDTSPEACVGRLAEMGPSTIVLKQGAAGCALWAEGALTSVPIRTAVEVVDTTAAGDSFNAGFLAGLHQGLTPEEAALAGHDLAGRVIGWRGAILPA